MPTRTRRKVRRVRTGRRTPDPVEEQGASSRLLLGIVVVLLASLSAHGVYELRVGGVGFPPWAFGAVGSLLVVLLLHLSGAGRFRPLSPTKGIVGWYFLLTMWMVVASMRSSQPFSAFAVTGGQVVNLLLLCGVSTLGITRHGLRELNRLLFLTGVAVAVLSIILFIPAAMRFPDLALREGVGWVYDRGLALRSRGLTTDPNFFSLYLALPLLIGLADRSLPGRRPGLVAIIVALFLAQSRTFVAALAFALLLGIAGMVRAGRQAGWQYARKVGGLALVVGAIAVAGVSFDGPVRQSLLARVESVGDQSRLPKWAEAWHEMTDPLLGSGLMSLNRELGRFSHSTVLDVFVELGIVGLVLWAGFLGSVLLGWWRLCRWREAVPWFQMWVLVIVMSQAFSLLYNPIFILNASVLGAWMAGRSEGVRDDPPAGVAGGPSGSRRGRPDSGGRPVG